MGACGYYCHLACMFSCYLSCTGTCGDCEGNCVDGSSCSADTRTALLGWAKTILYSLNELNRKNKPVPQNGTGCFICFLWHRNNAFAFFQAFD